MRRTLLAFVTVSLVAPPATAYGQRSPGGSGGVSKPPMSRSTTRPVPLNGNDNVCYK